MTGRYNAEQVLEQMAAEVAAMQNHIAKNEAMQAFGIMLLLEMQNAGVGNEIVAKAFESAFDLAVMGGMRAQTPEDKTRAQRCTAQLELMRTEWEKGLPHRRPPAAAPGGVMRFDLMPVERIKADWPRIAAILAPALRQSPGATTEGLRKRLEASSDHLFEIHGPGRCFVVLEVTGDFVCWTKFLGGRIAGGPKERLRVIRDAVAHIERVARDAGCKEHRLCGRDWRRILPDYLPVAGFPNELRKDL